MQVEKCEQSVPRKKCIGILRVRKTTWAYSKLVYVPGWQNSTPANLVPDWWSHSTPANLVPDWWSHSTPANLVPDWWSHSTPANLVPDWWSHSTPANLVPDWWSHSTNTYFSPATDCSKIPKILGEILDRDYFIYSRSVSDLTTASV
jgi:hypothetical protein